MLFPNDAAVALEWHEKQLLLNIGAIVPVKETFAVSQDVLREGYKASSLS